MRARIGKKSGQVAKAVALLKTPDRLSDLPTLDRLLIPMARVTAPLQRTIAQSGLKVTLGTIVLASACCAALGFAVVHYFLHLMLVAAVVGAIAACLPYGYVLRARGQRMLKFEEQFPEAIDLLSRALRAGHALTTGLSMVAEEMPAANRCGISDAVRPAELRSPALTSAPELRRAHSVPGCAVLCDGCPDAEGSGRKSFRGPR